MNRLLNVLLAFDVLVFALVTLGKSYPFESFSSAAYRAEKLGKFYGKARPVIDWLFFRLFGQIDHCRKAYEGARFNLPDDQWH